MLRPARTFSFVVPYAACAALIGLTGCPQPQAESPVKPQITASATRGPVPLRVTFSAAGSLSDNGGALTFLWDLAGEATATTETITHTFATPGRKLVRLTATDETGAQANATTDIRVAGGPVTAVIDADNTSGQAPLTVQFDGRRSDPPDDDILDYFWDFGDGQTSRTARPIHTYTRGGTYTVKLRAVSGGGVEGETQLTITVTGSAAALQFNGSQFATLPLGGSPTRTAFTIETWFRSEAAGGVLATLGDAVATLEVFPAENSVEWTVAGAAPGRATAAGLVGAWRHIAMTVDPEGGVRIYLDGIAIGTTAIAPTVNASQLIIGNGYVGKLGEVRFWATARSAAEIAAFRGVRIRTPQLGLIGAWPLSEGSGQTLRNVSSAAGAGVLGISSSVEAIDPAWTNDVPPLGG